MIREQAYISNSGQANQVCFRVIVIFLIILNAYIHGRFAIKSCDIKNNLNSPLRGEFSLLWYKHHSKLLKRNDRYSTDSVQVSTQNVMPKEAIAEKGHSVDKMIERTLKHPKMIADYQFAERLRQCQKNDSFPLVNDVIVVDKKNMRNIYVIINNGNALPAYRNLRDMNVKLVYGNQTFRNLFKAGKEDNIRLLKYVVKDVPLTNTVTLIDHATSWKYQSLPFQVLPVQPKRKVAICAYISDYNSANEINRIIILRMKSNHFWRFT